MTARRHHYISQCYLKSFAVPRRNGSAQLHVFDRVTRKAFATATDNVALERDFNRVEIPGFEPDAFENALSGFEGQLAGALSRTIEAAKFQSDEDRAVILNFIALLALRNPRWRESMRSFQEQILKRMMDLTLASKERWERQEKKVREAGYSKGGREISYEEIKAFHEAGEYKIALDTGYQIQMELKGFEAVLPYLFERRWWVMRAPRDSGGFVTSDHPVSLMWSNPNNRGSFYSPGFGLKGTQVLFSLSPSLALAGAFELREDAGEIPEAFVAAQNGNVILTATRQVYARDMRFRYLLRKEDGIRKASRLIDDRLFRQHDRGDNEEAGLPDPEDIGGDAEAQEN